MEEIFVYVAVSILSFLLGWYMREFIAVQIINRRQEMFEEYERETILRTYLRYDNEIFYVYNSDSKAFLTQAKTKEQIIEFFKATYPEKRVIMGESDIELLEKHGV